MWILRGAVEPAKGGAQRRAQCKCTTSHCGSLCSAGRQVAWHGMAWVGAACEWAGAG